MSLKPARRPADKAGENDELLLLYLEARDDIEAGRRLSDLIGENDWMIKAVITAKLGLHPGQTGQGRAVEDYDDIYADALLRVIGRLNALRNGDQELPIRSLSSYLAAVARNSCDEFLRRAY